VITVNGKQYTEEDLTPEQIREVEYMMGLAKEADQLSRRLQDAQIALRIRQQSFAEQLEKGSADAAEDA